MKVFECGYYWSKRVNIVIPGNNGIPKWISQQKKGSQITIELPMDWYQNNDFLGFALYFVYVPSDIKLMEDLCSVKCKLTFHGHSLKPWTSQHIKYGPSINYCLEATTIAAVGAIMVLN